MNAPFKWQIPSNQSEEHTIYVVHVHHQISDYVSGSVTRILLTTKELWGHQLYAVFKASICNTHELSIEIQHGYKLSAIKRWMIVLNEPFTTFLFTLTKNHCYNSITSLAQCIHFCLKWMNFFLYYQAEFVISLSISYFSRYELNTPH